MKSNSFQFSIQTAQKPSDVYLHLLDPRNWWVGLFNEEIKGQSKEIGNHFIFKAGDGVHTSTQVLSELVPNEKIVWVVTESNLSFLKNTNEWAGTKISFEIEKVGDKTKVTFSHIGLIPKIECYEGCSGAWTLYLQNLKLHLG